MRFFFTGKWRMRTAKRILGRQEAAFFRLVIPLEENGQVTECRAAKENGQVTEYRAAKENGQVTEYGAAKEYGGERLAVDNQTAGMKNDNDKNIKTRYDISKMCIMSGIFPDIPERIPEVTAAVMEFFPVCG